jgi:hypothetical protein
MLRPVYAPGGEIVRRPNGGIMFEHDTLAQFRHDWVPLLIIAAGFICLGWAAVRGVRFLYDRARNKTV